MPFASISALAEILGWKLSTLLTVDFAFSTRISTCSTLKERDCFYFVTAGFVIWEFGFSFTLVNRQRRSNTHRIRYEYPTWQYFSLFHSYLTLIFLKKEIDPSTAAHILESVVIDARSEATRSTSWFLRCNLLGANAYTQSNFENCVIGWIVKNFHFLLRTCIFLVWFRLFHSQNMN